MEKNFIVENVAKLHTLIHLLYDKLSYKKDSQDTIQIEWKSGKKKYKVDDLSNTSKEELLAKFYLIRKLEGYNISKSKQAPNTWICSKELKSYIIILDGETKTCNCPDFSYRQHSTCKHINMVEGLRAFVLFNKSELMDHP